MRRESPAHQGTEQPIARWKKIRRTDIEAIMSVLANGSPANNPQFFSDHGENTTLGNPPPKPRRCPESAHAPYTERRKIALILGIFCAMTQRFVSLRMNFIRP
jgi:hypothetical protein